VNYEETIAYLYDLQKHGMKLGLENIRRLLSILGDPQDSFRSVHVAGTNGKGSTSAMIESMIRTSGARTGLFTSPHLISFTERIRVNGREISESEVVALADEVRSAASGIEGFTPTFFEVTTAIAFLYFRKMKVDWAVVEVGMGGRLDATNVLMPEASVITSIGMDHSEYLGPTISRIAGEKAGIIKETVPVITAPLDEQAMQVISGRASECGSELIRYGREFTSSVVSDELTGLRIDYAGIRKMDSISVGLAGGHQAVNAAVAIRTIEALESGHKDLGCNIALGLRNTYWPGRLEFVKNDPPILIDGAHNPQAAETLAVYLRKALNTYSRIILVMGIMSDKDRAGIMRPLLPLASEMIFTAPAYGRAASADCLAAEALEAGFFPKTSSSVAEAIGMAEGLYVQGDLIVVTGSFYTIGEAKEALGQPGVLTRLREC